MPRHTHADAGSGSRPITAIFRTDELVPTSGLYVVVHSIHRVPRMVFLAAGHKFPGCSRCAEFLQFWLLQKKLAPSGVAVIIRDLPAEDDRAKTAIEY